MTEMTSIPIEVFMPGCLLRRGAGIQGIPGSR